MSTTNWTGNWRSGRKRSRGNAMAAVNAPVLVGPVQLRYVQSMTINEGYRIERIMGSRFSQATQPTYKTIAIDAVLLGPDRLVQKKELEALALVSRLLVA